MTLAAVPGTCDLLVLLDLHLTPYPVFIAPPVGSLAPRCPEQFPKLQPTAVVGCSLQKQRRESLIEMGHDEGKAGPSSEGHKL